MRKSLVTVEGMGTTALGLAFQHGPVAKMLRVAATKVVTQSAHDCIAREKLSVAQASLATCLETGHVCPSGMSGSEVLMAMGLAGIQALGLAPGAGYPI